MVSAVGFQNGLSIALADSAFAASAFFSSAIASSMYSTSVSSSLLGPDGGSASAAAAPA